MSAREASSALIIGNGTIAARCSTLLLERGWDIPAIYSTDGSLVALAKAHGVEHLDDRRAVRAFVEPAPVDVIFSVNNPWILRDDVLRGARRRTINFHDSPLPKYAGLHATSWAIMHGETEHGITWHEVVEAIDAGAILAQARFPIEAQDTALSVNARALEVALSSFEKLVEDLELGTERARPQARDGGSYFGLRHRPFAAAILSYNMNVEEARNLVRALDFGHAPNPLGRAKIILPHRGAALVGALRRVSETASEPNGVVSAVRDGEVEVTLGKERVGLFGLTDLVGRPLSEADLNERGVRVGADLPELSPEERRAIHRYNEALAPQEPSWVQVLKDASPLQHPFLASSTDAGQATRVAPLCLGSRSATLEELASAWAVIGYRLTGEVSFDLGWMPGDLPEAGRSLFSSVLPLRVDLADNSEPTVGTLREAVRTALAQARKRGGCGLDVFSRWPELRGRNLASFPLAVAELDAPSAPLPERAGPGLLLVAYADGAPSMLVASGLRESWQAEAVREQVEAVIEALRKEPSAPLARLPLMSANERKRVVDGFNRTARRHPCHRPIHALVREQALRTPERPAVRYGSDGWSFEELETRANRLARLLFARGARPGDRVALYLPRSCEQVAAMLAAAKVGAAYVPVDPSYPEERVHRIIEDADVRLALTTRGLQSELPRGVFRMCLDEEAEGIDQMSSEGFDVDPSSESPLYVIYTSGTTGTPKGVVVSHASVVNHAFAVRDRYGLSPDDRVLQSASLAFDVAGEQIWPTLLSGAEVVLRPEDLLESLGRFDDFVREEKISVLILPTAYWNEWLGYLQASNARVSESLRAIGVGTEKAVADKLILFRALCPGPIRFIHGYGPTEATITCAMLVLDASHPVAAGDEVPIGRPLDNLRIYVLDRNKEPVPVGWPGELHVAGRGLALGYHRRDALTKERFCAAPAVDEDRVYASGDRVRLRPDGQLVFLGRDDGQVKIRGYRVELGEIEAELRKVPEVREAVAHVLEGRGGRRLAAYVVSGEDQKIDVADLRRHLERSLAAYMVPSSFVILPRLPLTANGKVDRRALPVPSEEPDSAEGPRLGPRDDVELRVATVFERVLGLKGIDVRKSFFALGGHSLLALRLAGELRAEMGVELSLGTLFERPSVEGVVAALREGSPAVSRSHILPLQPEGSHPPLYFICGVNLYASLARGLGSSGPSYGVYLPLEEQILEGTIGAEASVETMAQRYVEALLAHQPEGPMSLAGISFGAILAFEVARQLHALGRRVPALVLLDPLQDSAKVFNPTRSVTSRAQKMLRWLRGADIPVEEDARAKAPSADGGIFRVDARRDHFYRRTARRYDRRRHRYTGRVILIRATDHGLEHCQLLEDLGFRNRVHGEFRQFQVPGDHLGILEEPATAAVLSHELARAFSSEAASAPLGNVRKMSHG